MRTVCIWRRESDYGRGTEDWIAEYERRTGREAESFDPDTPEGEDICRVYDVVEYPTIMVMNGEGTVMGSWRGKSLPLFDEVSYWASR